MLSIFISEVEGNGVYHCNPQQQGLLVSWCVLVLPCWVRNLLLLAGQCWLVKDVAGQFPLLKGFVWGGMTEVFPANNFTFCSSFIEDFVKCLNICWFNLWSPAKVGYHTSRSWPLCGDDGCNYYDNSYDDIDLSSWAAYSTLQGFAERGPEEAGKPPATLVSLFS